MMCFDCFYLFQNGEDRFAVLKKMRDLQLLQGEDFELARLESLTYDQVFVCGECSGWYGDDAIRITADELGAP